MGSIQSRSPSRSMRYAGSPMMLRWIGCMPAPGQGDAGPEHAAKHARNPRHAAMAATTPPGGRTVKPTVTMGSRRHRRHRRHRSIGRRHRSTRRMGMNSGRSSLRLGHGHPERWCPWCPVPPWRTRTRPTRFHQGRLCRLGTRRHKHTRKESPERGCLRSPDRGCFAPLCSRRAPTGVASRACAYEVERYGGCPRSVRYAGALGACPRSVRRQESSAPKTSRSSNPGRGSGR